MIKELSLPTRESPVSGKATMRVIAQDYYASQAEAVVNIDINANRAPVADFTVEQISGAAACGGFFIMENSIFKRLASFFMGGGQNNQKKLILYKRTTIMEEKEMPDLSQIKMQFGPKKISIQEYIDSVPRKYRRAATYGAYEVLRRGYPLNNGEIERLVRNDDNLQKLID